MPLYRVIRKSDSAEVYRYSADAPVEWVGMEFATHDHTEVVVPVEPPAPQPAPTPVRITRLAFRSRFTAAEKVTIEMAALDDPAAPAAQRQMAASLRVYLADIQAAQHVDLQRPDTRAGVEQLETFGLIGAGRAAVILDTPPTDAEVWNG